MTNLDSILKSRDLTLPTKVHLVKAIVFLVVTYGCESWTIKLSVEELMFLKCGVGEDLENPWTARRSNLSILKEIFTGRTDAEAELQYFGHRMQRPDSFEKTPILGKIEGRRRRG